MLASLTLLHCPLFRAVGAAWTAQQSRCINTPLPVGFLCSLHGLQRKSGAFVVRGRSIEHRPQTRKKLGHQTGRENATWLFWSPFFSSESQSSNKSDNKSSTISSQAEGPTQCEACMVQCANANNLIVVQHAI